MTVFSVSQYYYYYFFCEFIRAGSVIFLVGVGSLVCWKIWDYINSSDAIDPSHGGDTQSSPSSKTPSGKKSSKSSARSPKAFFASLLEEEFVHDFEEFEDEDPALIQGKYFGPESPVEHNPQLNFLEQKIPLKAKSPEVTSTVTSTEQNTPERLYTDDNSPLLSEYSCKTESGKPDIVDTSTAYLADDDDGSGTSEFEESLPLDSVSHSSLRETKRLKKRLRNQRLERSQESG
ncbi:hypothetical protein Anas_08104 [Armadillidium nasatum]|uniref:Uncharacterized protein n=1 Tax=Armadillidium nasatum TaxID=96803 RepID=A0A5N5TMA6_9CRUS|nr:hypothetical protein Anas_08104 [Armadillidium nasatum]